MRNFEERMAEIDRRSAEILKKRARRRKQLLTLCIPLVLCIGLFLWLLPGGEMESDKLAPGMEMIQENAMANGTASGAVGGMGGTRIEITDGIIASVCLDPMRTEPLANLLEELTALPESGMDISEGSNKDPGDENIAETEAVYDDGSPVLARNMTVIYPDGSKAEYRLYGNLLWRGQRAFVLTAEQVEAVLDALEGM